MAGFHVVVHPVAVETSKNETAETRSHAGLSRSSAGRQHVDEEQTGTFEGVCGCLATVTRSHATTATGSLPSLEQDIQTISALLPSEATLSRSANGGCVVLRFSHGTQTSRVGLLLQEHQGPAVCSFTRSCVDVGAPHCCAY